MTVDRSDWLDNEIFSFVIIVNAFYEPVANAFVFPAGFLRYKNIYKEFKRKLFKKD